MSASPSSDSPVRMGRGLWSDVLASVVRTMDTPPQVGEETTFVDSQGYQCTARIVKRVQPSEEPETSISFKIPADVVVEREGAQTGLGDAAEAGGDGASHDLGSMKLSVRNSFLHISMSDTAYDQVGAKDMAYLRRRR